jgi:hypothetical protein
VGIHQSIYKNSYNVSNISHMNSPPPLLSFITPPRFLEQLQQVSLLHLHTCVYIICTIFILLTLSPTPSPSHRCQPMPHSTLPPGRTCYFISFLHLLTWVYIELPPPQPPTSGQNLFFPLVLQFC